MTELEYDTCRICGETIGPDQPFNFTASGDPVHSECMRKEADE